MARYLLLWRWIFLWILFVVVYNPIIAQPPVGIDISVGLPSDPIQRAALLETLFGPGTYVDPASVQVNCPNTAIGTFDNGQAMGFQGSGKGIIMTTGSAIVAEGPNDKKNAGAQSSAGPCSSASGDPDIETLPGIGVGQTRDACSIEFNVQFSSSILQINNYIFASEEYPEYVNSNFNDVFAFLISAPGQTSPPYNYQSISLIPPTFTQPVAINTINQGPCCTTPTNPPNPPFQNCNCGEYVSNTLTNGDPNNNQITQYDGYTKPFYTTLNVIPLTWYHFKFVIADRFDCIFDSAILIQTEAVVGFGADPLPPPVLCADGKPRPIQYKAAGTLVGGALAYSPQNIFYLEMSDINGNFTSISNPPNTPPSTLLGTYTGNQLNGTIMATVPIGTPPGSGYKIRIRTVDTNPTPPLTNPFLTFGFPKNNQNLTITPPVSVTAGSDSPKCTGEILSLTAQANPSNGVTYQWTGPAGFTSTLQNPTRSGLTTAHSGVYTVVATLNGGCSETATVNVVVNPSPGVPSSQNVSRCGTGNVTFTATMGNPGANQMHLYQHPTGGVPIATSSNSPYELTVSNLTQTTTFYVAAYNSQTGCSSPRTQVIATINPIPANPNINPPDLSRCGPGPVTFSVSMGNPPGNVVNLYTTAQGGNPIASDNNSPYTLTTPFLTENTTFYVEAVNSNCFSSRVQVSATILPVPGQPSGINQQRCGSGQLTIPVSMGTPPGSQILVYTTSVGGNPVHTITSPLTYNTPNLSTTTTYYIEAVSNTTPQCTSTRVPVIATIHPNPSPPSINPASVNVCGAGNTATFTVNMGVVPGNVVYLYDQPQGGTAIASDNTPEYTLTTPPLNAPAVFYVEVVNGVTSCVSNRTPVNVSIIPIPTPPTATPANIEICGSGQVTFTANMTGTPGDFIRMFSQAVGGNVISSDAAPPYELTTPTITTTTTFYFEVATNTGCASSRSEAVAIVHPLPEQPNSAAISRCGPGPVTITATLNNFTNLAIQLYSVPSGGTLLGEQTQPPFAFNIPLVSTNTTFYLQTKNTTTNCLSSRIGVPITIHPVINEPTVNSPEICGSGSLTFTVTPNASSGGNVMLLYTLPS
ncbi:MAG: choice-of-anchor L domain-containing protein, partial [Bacteroidia bacterium]|nr:choice-of-anchor L domain-containing protein [Bacteroidia bacterium]